MRIQDLLEQPEGKTLEFKRDLSAPKSIIKALVAFANTAGGQLVVGVDDDKQLVGVSNPLDDEEKLANLVNDAIAPRLVPNIDMVTVEGKTLLVVEVFLSNTRPHYALRKGLAEGVYVRLGSSNRQADAELVAELQRSAGGAAFDEQAMPQLDEADLDMAAVQAAFDGARNITQADLLTLKILTHHQNKTVPTQGGFLLFGRQRNHYFSDAWVQCGRFLGTTKLDIFDHMDIHSPLPQTVDEVMQFLKKHAYRSADLSDVRRKDVWSIPLGILREVVINALAHCDYSQRGAPIRVTFLDDRIEVESPGILLPGMTIEEMKQGTSRIRNHVIARTFRELNLIEQWGTGVRRMFEEAKSQGLQEPKIEEVGLRLRVSVYLAASHTVNTERAQSGAQSGAQSSTVSSASSQASLILAALADKPRSATELVTALGLKSKTGAFKRTIETLLEAGEIEYTLPSKPSSRLQKYRLT
ncbi:MAG TPA: helix-turn-helix domain-containing protein, partial [Cellvibrionaceae bacterium]